MELNLKNICVLVVDDLFPIQQIMKATLSAMGAGSVIIASDGEDAYYKYKLRHPDLIITDWYMPNVDGMQLIRKIRTSADSPNRTIPIIMMSGFTSSERIAQARDGGATEFLAKPFSARDLSKRITHIISSPRDIIITPGFVGPDRRRKTENGKISTNRRTNKKDNRIKVSNILQEKTGLGLIPDERIKLSQNILDNNKIDFIPLAESFLEDLSSKIVLAKNPHEQGKKIRQDLIYPIMQLKANGMIFKYPLIGNLAGIALDFLEGLPEVNEYVLDIITAHHKTLKHLLDIGAKDDQSDLGKMLEAELSGACKRYQGIRMEILQRKLSQAGNRDEKSLINV